MDKLINDFSFGLFFWQAFILAVLIILMVKFAWRPIMDAIIAREEGIEKALESAERAKEEMIKLTADNDKILKEARAEREAILKDAKEIKDKMILDAKEVATIEAQKVGAAATAAIAVEKANALSEIKTQAAELSVAVAESILKKELASENKQDELIQSLLNDVKLN